MALPPLSAARADSELPLLGDEAPALLQKEDALGRGIYQRLLDEGLVIEDPLLADYLSDIGYTLLAALDRRLRDYHFFLVDNGVVNAFAAPGGYIGVHLGMIEQIESEDELAAVLAHEIAHVRLRHGLQLLEKMNQVSWLGMLGILNAVVLAGRDPEAAAAMIALTQAGGAQSMINFTRGNEYEADRVGLELLSATDYDPWAMADLMTLLQRKERSGELARIEYLRTHPVNANRIAEIRARLVGGRKKSRVGRFSQFRDYLFHLYPLRPGRKRPGSFAAALRQMREGAHEKAAQRLQRLIEQDADSIWYRSAAAENRLQQGRLDEAEALYRSLLDLYPEHFAISLRLAEVMLQRGRLEPAARLLERLRFDRGRDPRLYKLLVTLYQRQGRDLQKRLAQADYHWLKGNRKLALEQYRGLLDAPGLNLPERERIEQRMARDKTGIEQGRRGKRDSEKEDFPGRPGR
jgi:predicted Zn-dependent protease